MIIVNILVFIDALRWNSIAVSLQNIAGCAVGDGRWPPTIEAQQAVSCKLLKRSSKKLHDGPFVKSLDVALQNIGVEPQQYFGGNHIHRLEGQTILHILY